MTKSENFSDLSRYHVAIKYSNYLYIVNSTVISDVSPPPPRNTVVGLCPNAFLAILLSLPHWAARKVRIYIVPLYGRAKIRNNVGFS